MKSRTVRSIALALFAAVALATCGISSKGRQYWDEDRGPLVPHKSFPADCDLCHLPDGWESIRPEFSFDHGKETGHALNGAHERAACLRCHNDFGPVTMYTARGCAGCHGDIHLTAMGTDCLRCHNENNWRATGLVTEHARTRFPLIGRHLAVACVLCHPASPTGMFRGASTRCADCHQADLARARNPDHIAQGWTSRCEQCHTPSGWGASNFRHSSFPLTGAHRIAQCSACHKGGVFGSLPRDCLSCHQDDRARAPAHEDFSRQCQQCHGTSTWKGATFNHRFPIRGPHNADCNVCHVGGNTNTFTCLVCHDHSRARMAKKHDDERGYTYTSAACLQCHPNGRE